LRHAEFAALIDATRPSENCAFLFDSRTSATPFDPSHRPPPNTSGLRRHDLEHGPCRATAPPIDLNTRLGRTWQQRLSRPVCGNPAQSARKRSSRGAVSPPLSRLRRSAEASRPWADSFSIPRRAGVALRAPRAREPATHLRPVRPDPRRRGSRHDPPSWSSLPVMPVTLLPLTVRRFGGRFAGRRRGLLSHATNPGNRGLMLRASVWPFSRETEGCK